MTPRRMLFPRLLLPLCRLDAAQCSCTLLQRTRFPAAAARHGAWEVARPVDTTVTTSGHGGIQVCRLEAAHEHSERDSLLARRCHGPWTRRPSLMFAEGVAVRRPPVFAHRNSARQGTPGDWRDTAAGSERVSRLSRAPLQGSGPVSRQRALQRVSTPFSRLASRLRTFVSRENGFLSRQNARFPLFPPSSRWAAPRPPRLVTGRPGWSLFALSHGNACLGSGRPRRDDFDLSVPAMLQSRSFGRSPRALPFLAWHWKGRCPVCAPGAVRCTELVRRREDPREGKTLRPCSTQPPPVR